MVSYAMVGGDIVRYQSCMRELILRRVGFERRPLNDCRGMRMGRVWIFAAAISGLAACGQAMDPAESLAKGQALFDQGDLASALIELKNAVQGAPEDAVARFALARAHLKISNSGAALKEFKRARSLGMVSDDLNQGITRALIASGNMDEAATELAISGTDSSAQWNTLQGLLDLAVGRFEEARAVLAQAIELEPDNVEARRAMVRAALGMGDTKQAREALREALALTQTDYETWLLKGDLDRHDQEFSAAGDAYSKALEIIPGSPVALLGRASVRAAALDNDGALADLEAIGQASTEDPRALYLRALIARQQDKPNLALRYLRQVLQVIPQHRDSLAQAATIHFKLNDLSEAKRYLNRLLAIDPGNEQYRRMLGAVELASGNVDSGLEILDNVDIDTMSDPRLLALLGTAYLKHGKIDDGTRSLARAVELAPDSIPIRTQLAFSKLRGGKVDEALRDFAAIRTEAPDFMLAGVLQAFGYAVQDDKTAALAAADELIKHAPEIPVVYNVRGYLHGLFGDPEKATIDFETALRQDPGFHPASINLARIASQGGNDVRAKEILRSTLDRSPHLPHAMLFLASILVKEGDTEKALSLWEEARENNPNAVEPRILLSRYHRNNGNNSAAQAMAEEAYDIGPYVPAAQFEFAITKMNAGDPHAALVAIKAMVERFPKSVQALELLAQAYDRMGDAAALEATLATIVERFPAAIAARVSLARLYLRREDYNAATNLATALILDGGAGAAAGHGLVGDINFAQQQISNALAAYEKAYELDPSSQSLLRVYGVRRRAGGGVDMLTEWLVEYPDDVAVHVAVAMDDFSAGRQSEAIARYETILEIAPDNIIALNNMAWIFDEKNDDRAADYARRAYEAAPGRPEVVDTYGWIMLRKGNHEQAVALLSKAMGGAPDNPDIRYHFASALVKAGDNLGALRELETILDGDAIFPSRVDAEALLQTLGKQ